jgi:hypothetical protein
MEEAREKPVDSEESVPVEKIGLFGDEYRQTLPGDDDVDCFGKRATRSGPGYEIRDREFEREGLSVCLIAARNRPV